MKYFLSVIAMFKNESFILEQWITNYLLEGVDHFYLIDNGSTDKYMTIIEKYKDKISLVKDNLSIFGAQDILFNKYYLNTIKKESEWIIVCDIDEFIFNRNHDSTIKKFLQSNELIQNFSRINIPWKNFGGTEKYIIPNLIKDLTKRKIDMHYYKLQPNGKSITKTKDMIKLHHHRPFIKNRSKVAWFDYNSEILCNHYRYISSKYLKEVKCVRGGGNTRMKCDYNFFLKNLKLDNEITDNLLKNKRKTQVKFFKLLKNK